MRAVNLAAEVIRSPAVSHGVGASVVNALSRYWKFTFIVKVKSIISNLTAVSQRRFENHPETDHTGTTVHFIPDGEIFTDTLEYDFDTLATRIRELAFLNKGLEADH